MPKIGAHIYVPYSMNLTYNSQNILLENDIPYRVIKHNRTKNWVVFNKPEEYHKAREVLGLKPKESYWLDAKPDSNKPKYTNTRCPIKYLPEQIESGLFAGVRIV